MSLLRIAELEAKLARRDAYIAELEAKNVKPVEPVATIVSSGPADLPILQWLSADHSFRVPIGSMLYTAPQEPAGWQPIATAPKETRTMFTVIAFDVNAGSGGYNSDPWCVWHERGAFVRWPHKFEPTHWAPLPAAPKATP